MPDAPAILQNLVAHGPSSLLRASARRLELIATSLERADTNVEFEAKAVAQQQVLDRNAQFAGSLTGQRVFVIGNGPSLARQDLNQLVGENIIVVNSFWRHPLLTRQRACAYCLADPAWFEGRQNLDEELVMMRLAAEATPFFLPLWAQPVVESRQLFAPEQAFYCRFIEGMDELEDFGFDLTDPIPSVQSVSQMAILVALYMGGNPIYLVGMDHDWMAGRGRLQHFYEEEEATAPRATIETPYEHLLETQLKLWRGYRHLRTVAEASGRFILNATQGGYLDVFERTAYEGLFEVDGQ